MEYFSIDGLEDEVKDKIHSASDSIHAKMKEAEKYNCDPANNQKKDAKKHKHTHGGKHTHGDSSNNQSANTPPVYINHVKFNKCQTRDANGHCITDIYTYDDFGLPVSNNVSSRENINILYAEDEEYIPDPDTSLLKKTNEECDEGVCADGVTCADSSDGSNCGAFTKKSGLIGSPVTDWSANALGGSGKRMFIDESSGNSYMDYINSNTKHEGFSNSGREEFSNINNICNITKYAILICIVLLIGLITGVYVKRS